MAETKTPIARESLEDSWESLSKTVFKLKSERDALLDACKAIYACIESQMLVRNIAHDSEPGWAIKQIPLARALSQLKEAIERAGPDAL